MQFKKSMFFLAFFRKFLEKIQISLHLEHSF